jgi:hypothetical protein
MVLGGGMMKHIHARQADICSASLAATGLPASRWLSSNQIWNPASRVSQR